MEGLDCLGLIHVFYRQLGIMIPIMMAGSIRQTGIKKIERFYRGLQKIGSEISPTHMKPLIWSTSRLAA